MHIRASAAIAGTVLTVLPFLPASPDPSPAGPTELESFLAEACTTLEVPGAAVVVARRGEAPLILTHGTRRAGGAEPVGADTAFGLGSLTKAFTATSAAALVGEGAVGWDTRIRSLVPELELPDPVAAERVTLRDLLAHRSGLASYDAAWLNLDGDPGLVVPRLGALEPAAELRDRFVYSSLGYTLAGEAIGRADGSSWEEVVRRRLLRPAGMTSTTLGAPRGPAADVAAGHWREGGRTTPLEPVAMGVSGPGNGLYSTATDVARWLDLLLDGGAVGDVRVVDEAALRETWTPQTAIRSPRGDVRAYGLGWYVGTSNGRRHLFHGGGGIGFTSQVLLVPEDGVAIAVLANVAASGLPDLVAQRAAALVLGEDFDEGLLAKVEAMTRRIDAMREQQAAALWAHRDAAAAPSAARPAYAGCYESSTFGRLEIAATAEGLRGAFHGIPLAVEHLHDDVFVLSSPYTGHLEATFTVRDDTATAVATVLDGHHGRTLFARRPDGCGVPGPESPSRTPVAPPDTGSPAEALPR